MSKKSIVFESERKLKHKGSKRKVSEFKMMEIDLKPKDQQGLVDYVQKVAMMNIVWSSKSAS